MTRLVLQLHFDRENRIGPGKIELLERIEQTGSISAARRAMDMSYRRAWLLVDAMNRTFNAPVVATRLGGTSTGRATLTPLGREVVQLYREISEAARSATDSRMGIPVLISRSGFTAWGVELARQAGLTLIGRARGKRFLALSGAERIVFDQSLDYVAEESARRRRKAAADDD